MTEKTGTCNCHFPYPHGVKIDCLCDSSGYVYNSMVSSHDPLKYDEACGRVVAICYALLSLDNLKPNGKSYLNENRIVRFTVYFQRNRSEKVMKQLCIDFHGSALHVCPIGARDVEKWDVLGGNHFITQQSQRSKGGHEGFPPRQQIATFAHHMDVHRRWL